MHILLTAPFLSHPRPHRMLSLGSARAAFVLYQNARAVSGAADHLSRYILPLLRVWSIEQDSSLLTLLETLGTRGDSIVPVIEFLQEWSTGSGSSLTPILVNAKDLLRRIETFLLTATTTHQRTKRQHQHEKSAGGNSAVQIHESEKDALIKQIKHYLKELDFIISSLNLAVSVANASQAFRPTLPYGATIANTSSSSSFGSSSHSSSSHSSSQPPRYISPSCLLRATDRLRSVGHASGDVLMVTGSLYAQRSKHAGEFTRTIQLALEKDRLRQQATTTTPPVAVSQQTARWITPMSPVADGYQISHDNTNDSRPTEWMTNETHFSPSSRLEPIDVNAGHVTRVNEPLDDGEFQSTDDVDDWSPLVAPHSAVQIGRHHPSPPDMTLSPSSPPNSSLSAPPSSSAETRCSHGTATPTPSLEPYAATQTQATAAPVPLPPHRTPPSDSHSTSTSTPLTWRQVHSAASLKLVRNGQRNMYELHICSLEPSSDGISRPSTTTLKFDMIGSLEFRSTTRQQIGLFDVASVRGTSAPPQPVVDAVFTFEDRIANVVQERYAFMVHPVEQHHSGGGGVGIGSDGFTPLNPNPDSMRPLDIAYLARLCMYENLHADGPSRSSAHRGGVLRHTQASDEELWLLLAGVHIYGENGEPQVAQPPPPPLAPTSTTPSTHATQPTNTDTTPATDAAQA